MVSKCSKCGSEVHAGDSYCPVCGNRLMVGFEPGNVPKLILVYGVAALALGLLLLACLSVLEEVWQEMESSGETYGITYEQIENMWIWLALAPIASGSCALASGVLAKKLAYGKVCTALCLLASVLVFLVAVPDVSLALYGVIPFIVGIIMTYYLYAGSDSFKS